MTICRRSTTTICGAASRPTTKFRRGDCYPGGRRAAYTRVSDPCERAHGSRAAVQMIRARSRRLPGPIEAWSADKWPIWRPRSKRRDAATLEYIHRSKTAALIRALHRGGRNRGRRGERRLERLRRFGENIGWAFQVVDDILDVEESSAALGKDRRKRSGAAEGDLSGALRP